ncbi:MAG: DUF5320 domain-containing protein [Clostridiales bacterium]|nr:DUF5320 domain-containing protein [Clostridiales bacterium]
MPAGNKTGPLGQGPMTGRGMGTCNTNNTSANNSFFGFGRGFGRSGGFGFRRGFGQGYVVDQTNDNEVQSLKDRIAKLEDIIKNK